MRVTLMHSPGAGGGSGGRDELCAAVEAAGHRVRYRSVAEPGWRDALDEPADLVVVAGGDGTVSTVFRALAGRGVPATIVPLGTANNVARTLGLRPGELEQAARSWPALVLRPYDLGIARAAWGEARFAEVWGGGAFARTLRRAERADDEPSGSPKLRFARELLRDELASAAAEPWAFELDGRAGRRDLVAVLATIGREIGPNVPIAPAADPGDGLLDVVLLGSGERDALCRYLEERLRGRDPAPPALGAQPVREARLWPPPGCPLHADDELWGADPPHAGDPVDVSAGGERIAVLAPA